MVQLCDMANFSTPGFPLAREVLGGKSTFAAQVGFFAHHRKEFSDLP